MSADTIQFGTDRIAVVGGVLLTTDGDAVEFDTFAEAEEAAEVFGGAAFRVVAL